MTRLERLPGEPLDPRTVTDRAAARERITDREIDDAVMAAPKKKPEPRPSEA